MTRAAQDEYNAVEDAHWWFVVRRRILLDRFTRIVAPGSDKLIVEIGCGPGGNLAALARHYRMLGIDPDPISVERARAKSGAETMLGALPDGARLIPREVDGVVCLDVLEHIADDRGALAAMAERMPSETPLLVFVPAIPSLMGAHDHAVGHLRRYTRGELVEKMEQTGFRVEFTSYFNSLLLPPAWLWRKIRGKRGSGTDLAMPPEPVNWALTQVFGLERWLLKAVRLPIGLSLMAEARRR